MKKKSKVIGKDYDKLEKDNLCYRIDYYGLIAKDGRIKIDTKRYKKFFAIPDSKIGNRHSVYYLPTKQHRSDYKCNWFRDLLSGYKQLWFREYKSFIDSIKTPKQVEDNARLSYLSDGVLEYDEATASLDVENETLIQSALSRLIKDKTVLVIVHRMMTVAGADKIVVLSNCIVAEQGKPDELYAENGR